MMPPPTTTRPAPDRCRPVPSGFARLAAAFALVLGALAPLPASAVLIATGDGTGNTTAPSPDPGFANVAVIGVLSGVYVRNGWILTAGHVGAKPTELLGETYQPVPGSAVQFQNPGGGAADLMAFKLLDAFPPLPDLALADSAPTLGTDVTMIGHGLNRGVPLMHMGQDGWDWAVGWVKRWGTNAISDLDSDGTWGGAGVTTESFGLRFDEIATPAPGQHEAACTHGDSGGAVFAGSGASTRLVGIQFAVIPTLVNQPSGSSFYTNECLAADLFQFRSDILAVIDQPGCSDGLDDDGDGLTDHPDDPGCTDPSDTNERGPAFTCDNGIDEDGDGAADYPADSDCTSPTSNAEAVQAPSASLGGGLLAIALYAASRPLLRTTPTDRARAAIAADPDRP
jgi:hypothetical protein